MTPFVTLLILALGAPVLCQNHVGPIGTNSPGNECYHCDAHHWAFPGCLRNTKTCHMDEVCQIVYGNGYPEMDCRRAEECAHQTAHPMRDCTGGGVEIHPGECQICCKDASCTDPLVQLLKLEFEQQDQLFCPGHCDNSDIGTCITNGKYCSMGQYCQVEQEHGQVRGHCRDAVEMHHCQEDIIHHSCDHNLGHDHGPHHEPHGKCVWDCCVTTDCLMGHFGAFLTTKAPMTTAAPVMTTAAPVMTTMAPVMTTAAPVMTDAPVMTTAAPVMTTAAPVMTTMMAPVDATADSPANMTSDPNCQDHLSGVGCQELQDVCTTVLALSVCPKYCGLC